ncbi:MAG: cytochrome c1 [Candidatus Paracaedibacteraceae bacterium]|nr:cytochrome c1 [Candidatus Paracaedibacteraceae bacterium]
MKRTLLSSFILGLVTLGTAIANTDAKHPKEINFSFKGSFGTFKRAELQRGFEVYKNVCASCHAIDHLRFGNLQGKGKGIHEIRESNLGLTKDEVAALAAEYKVPDINGDGEPIERKATAVDKFPKPYPNQKAARAANNGAYPPDLSMVVKARKFGPDYVYSLLTGYEKAPEGVEIGEGRHYNPYFSGGQISMAQPLHTEGQVTYSDGTKATVEQMAHDVTAFLAWASEPESDDRKQMGIKVMFYLLIMSIVMYLSKRRIWADVK